MRKEKDIFLRSAICDFTPWETTKRRCQSDAMKLFARAINLTRTRDLALFMASDLLLLISQLKIFVLTSAKGKPNPSNPHQKKGEEKRIFSESTNCRNNQKTLVPLKEKNKNNISLKKRRKKTSAKKKIV